MDAHAFLQALAVVLCTAAVTTVVFQWLRQPVVLGYLLAGLVVGPHLPIPLIADPRIVHTLSELGVILLMFSLGLEFSLRKLWRVGPVAGITALLATSVMVSLGYLVGAALGWAPLERVFAGAIVAISSTVIVSRTFAEAGVTGRLRDFVFGLLVVEDLIAILLVTVLTAVGKGQGLSASDLGATIGRLAAFLGGVVVVGLLVVPPVFRAIVRLGRAETTLVASVGLCFALALLAHDLGYSVALGAFLAGALLAEAGVEHEVARLVEPVRDVFAAVFFVSVGMLIDPALVVAHAPAVLLLIAAVLVGKASAVTLGAFVTGNGIPTAVRAGLSMAQIGEFSFILAGVGASLGAIGPHLYPIAVTVSAVTALTTPWFVRGSGAAASWIDRHLPTPIQTFATLYSGWIERLRASSPEATPRRESRRTAILLALDAAALIAIVVGTALANARLATAIDDRLGLGVAASGALVVAAGGLLSLPFVVGLARMTRRLANALAAAALPTARTDAPDLSIAPRRALVIVLELATLAAVGVPIVALTLPFVPSAAGAALLAVILLVLALLFWRRAADLEGHVRAGTEVIVEALGAQIRRGAASPLPHHAPVAEADPTLAPLANLLPGLGDPAMHHLDPGAYAVGRTLAALDLRGATGATVLAIGRASRGAFVPGPADVLEPGDVLTLAGSHDAVARAGALLDHGPTAADDLTAN